MSINVVLLMIIAVILCVNAVFFDKKMSCYLHEISPLIVCLLSVIVVCREKELLEPLNVPR
jgi:hypothetical protein